MLLRGGAVLALLALLVVVNAALMLPVFSDHEAIACASGSAEAVLRPLLECGCTDDDLVAEAAQLRGTPPSPLTASAVRCAALRRQPLASTEVPLTCVSGPTLATLSLHRDAVPWLRITSAAHRTAEGWAAADASRAPDPLEVTVAVTDLDKDFASYLCADTPNASRTEAYELRHTGAAERDGQALTRCTGCTFQCVHPRLLRRRGGGGWSAGDATESYAVSLEDVDAGLARAPLGVGAERQLTRADLFTCKLLNQRTQDRERDSDNRALLLSADVWLSHFGGGLPLFFTNSTLTASGEGVAVVRRLLPLHTAAFYGESLQSYASFALRPLYWLQYDAVYLQNRVRRPALQPVLPATNRGHGVTGVPAPPTLFGTWTVTSNCIYDFYLIVHLNQLRRTLQNSGQMTNADAPTEVRASDVVALLASSAMPQGKVARLALEVMHGSDPMLLPLRGERMSGPRTPLGWRPPTLDDWATAQAPPRLRAIAVAISNCWHGRMAWLSELSRYYPVHNFGGCTIPDPTPLPGDAPPTPGVPQRARLPFPEECRPAVLQQRHAAALEEVRIAHGGSAPARGTVHNPGWHELRCVFRRYRYVMPYENTVEDDYVTEKVYNALLSGAVPLYIGAANVHEYVPRAATAAAASSGGRGDAAGAAGVPSLRGLSVLPVLQMFPLLNGSAWVRECRGVQSSHESDELLSRQVLRTHAAVLRAQVVASAGAHDKTLAHVAARVTASTVAAALGTASQTSRHVADHHFLLYKDASNAPSVAERRAAFGESASPAAAASPALPNASSRSAVTGGCVATGRGQCDELCGAQRHLRVSASRSQRCAGGSRGAARCVEARDAAAGALARGRLRVEADPEHGAGISQRRDCRRRGPARSRAGPCAADISRCRERVGPRDVPACAWRRVFALLHAVCPAALAGPRA